MIKNVVIYLGFGLAAVGPALGAEGTSAGPTWPTVRIWPEAVVQADRVKLADLASVTGLARSEAEAMLQVEVGLAAKPGQARRISIDEIRKALTAGGVNLAAVCLVGAAECRVYRAKAAEERPDSRRQAEKRTAPVEPSRNTLASAVRRFLQQRLAHLGGKVEVRFGAAGKAALGICGKDVTFRVRPRGNALLGLVAMDADVLEGGRLVKTVPIVAEVALLRRVAVARRAINRGAVIRNEDVRLEERRFRRLERIGLTDVAAAVGQQAKRYIARGEMIDARDIRPLPLVKRGDYVTVWLKRGGLVIRGSAKALQSGTYAQRIEVRAEPGGQVYTAVVTGPKTVQADLPAQEAASGAG